MANPSDRATFLNYSPLREDEREGEDIDGYEDRVSPDGCSCFRFFSLNWGGSKEREQTHYLQQEGGQRESWAARKLKEAKEISELVAGPKWKNFIRKFSGNRRQKNKFQYDPQSYALNFDGGFNNDEDGSTFSFLPRFSAPTSTEQR